MPRYYISKIYAPKIFLSSQLEDFLFKKSLLLRDEQFETVQAQHPDWSLSQIFSFLSEREVSEYKQRSASASKTLTDFYEKGSFDKHKNLFKKFQK